MMLLSLAGRLAANDLRFNFNDMPTNEPPAGCVGILGGEGKHGVWKVIRDEVPVTLAPISPDAPKTMPANVVAQLSWDATDNRYPMLLLSTNSFGDFTASTQFKMAEGLTEQTAGIAFRLQDERNYFYVRASAIGNNLYFYRVFKGVQSKPIGNNIRFKRGEWHTLAVQCSGPNIHISLDGREALPMLTDPTFAAGKIALWTKSDSITYFTDTHITYTPRESFAQTMVRQTMEGNSHLLGIRIYAAGAQSDELRVIASNNDKDIGQPGDKTDRDVIDRGVSYVSRNRKEGSIEVSLPLHDRNGDAVASVHLVMKSFPGQTEDNALGRAHTVMTGMEAQAASVAKIN
jgi:hypothetical protein